MSDANNQNYEQIGYNGLLQVDSGGLLFPLGANVVDPLAALGPAYANPAGPAVTDPASMGSVQEMVVKTDGTIDDVVINNSIQSTNWQPKVMGFYIDGQTGYAEFSSVYISGTIVALTGTIGGFVIGSDYIRDSANSFGLSSTITGGNDVRFWAGDTFANRAIAPFRVFENGEVDATTIFITGTSTIGGRLNTTIASVIDVNGQIVTSRFNTESKQILDGFKFTSSGALNVSGTQTAVTVAALSGDTTLNVTSTTSFPSSGVFYLQGNTNWMRITYTGKTGTTLTGIPSSSTGSITEASAIGQEVIGGPGVLITPKGIISLNATGVETITLNGTTGDATFAGTLVAAAGTLGTITAGTIIGALIETATSGQRITINESSNNSMIFYDSAGQVIGIGTNAGTAITMTMSSVTATNGIDISNSISNAAHGFRANWSNSTNSGACYEMINAGSNGFGILGTISGGARGIYIGNTGAGASIELNDSGSSPSSSIVITKASTGTGSSAINITYGAGSGTATGIVFNLSGGGNPYAFSFTGSEFASSGFAGSIFRKVRVLFPSGNVGYIYCYDG